MKHELHSIRRFAPLCATAADGDSEIALRRAESRALRAIHDQDKRGFYMSENKIEIRDMNLYYGDFHALHGINLDIKANEITAFIGPSGCGKSTLLRSLNRMNDLVEGCRITGDIRLDGQDIYRNCDVNLLRRRVGMVFQKPNPFPMSIYDNIAYGPRTHGIRSRVKLDEIVETSLRHAAIWDETKDSLNKSALSMSGGQQQRICIARALAADPEVVCLQLRQLYIRQSLTKVSHLMSQQA